MADDDREIRPEVISQVLALWDETDDRGKHRHSKKEISTITGLQTKVVRELIQNRPAIEEPEQKDTRTPVSDTHAREGAPAREGLSGLSQETIAKNLVTYIAASKRGIKEIRESRDIKNFRDRSQMEAQWMHIYGAGIKMGIKATGLSAESLMIAVEDYEIDVSSALERFNSKYRDDTK